MNKRVREIEESQILLLRNVIIGLIIVLTIAAIVNIEQTDQITHLKAQLEAYCDP